MIKQFSKIQLELLHLLSDGNCHSGKLIGQQLGISRTAVWKQIGQLAELGLSIQRIQQQGYQLTYPMIPLDEQLICQHLKHKSFNKPIHFHLFASLDSTNQFLKELTNSSVIDFCCAEKQTQGRGRFGRQWYSPFGENIYFSSRWELNCCLSQLSGLSLVVGLAILASLKETQIQQEIRIKWPNDVLWGDKKLSGILIEVIAETNSRLQLIIGIGLNVNMAAQEQSLPDRAWCSLHEITGCYFDRNILLANLLYSLDQYLEKFLGEGLKAFATDWQKVDYLKGQFITVTQPTGSMSGYACGVNELGQLCLQDQQGKLHYFSSGDTSLRG